jgi:hypothetical protein
MKNEKHEHEKYFLGQAVHNALPKSGISNANAGTG